MAGRLIGAWNPALDSSGDPISGSKLTTWTSGTTTPKPTFTDSSLTVNLTNPVVADSAGRFPEIWSADGGTYDLKWTDAGGTQIELFQGIQALGSAASGAIMRDFGADGRFNLESRGGTTYLEGGDPSPDNLGGAMRLGGWEGSQLDILTIDAATVLITGTLSGTVQRGAIAGLTLSTAGSSATFGVSVGQATDSAGAVSMPLSVAFTKTASLWVAGSTNGALDTGTVANSTWYHAYLIQRQDNNLVDVIVSTSAAGPALPSGYTRYRRIGAMKTDGSAKWTQFSQKGNEFLWTAPTNDGGVATSTTPSNLTVNVPLGVQVNALLNSAATIGGGVSYILMYSPDQGAQSAVSTGSHTLWADNGSAANGTSGLVSVRTSTAQAIKVVASNSTPTLYTVTQGWIDRRGIDD